MAILQAIAQVRQQPIIIALIKHNKEENYA
jgi:hypothetical protein